MEQKPLPNSNALLEQHDLLVEAVARRIKIPQWAIATNRSVSKDNPVLCPALREGSAYPDLVMTERFTERIAAVGELETETTLQGEQADATWKVTAYLAPKFFIYVPEGCEADVQERLRRARIRPAGLFVYFFNANNTLMVRRVGR